MLWKNDVPGVLLKRYPDLAKREHLMYLADEKVDVTRGEGIRLSLRCKHIN
jgi:hypothetical protein